MDSTIELIAAVCGLTGTLLLATQGRWAGWGFVAFLCSNAGWLSFALAHGYQFMFWQQFGFTISSLIGIWVWLIRPIRAQTRPPASQVDCGEGANAIAATMPISSLKTGVVSADRAPKGKPISTEGIQP